ncbi:hypothetical protein HA052_04870 [Chromobacterium haemolyticum]|uniref:Acyl carrier protein n=1 Tax=Chromobacterium fluminis TaxID=3044269 RepID=A0ABX0L0Q6_9NEIS|nr:hypothetical protein [Chromobacterium haemolyticum]NHR04523.1 hypothetical protein [Chromobacterium haemolyticum]
MDAPICQFDGDIARLNRLFLVLAKETLRVSGPAVAQDIFGLDGGDIEFLNDADLSQLDLMSESKSLLFKPVVSLSILSDSIAEGTHHWLMNLAADQ